MKRSAGGLAAVFYSLGKARQAGMFKMYRALRAPNACKTCGLGMGGQDGGMRNEIGRFPSVCKKSVQAMAADMQGAIRPEFFARYSLDELKSFTPRELEAMGRLNDPVYAGPGDTHYRVIGWDEAQTRVAERLRAIAPEQAFFYFSGRSSNEAGFLLQLFARIYGSNHVNNCSYYCHQASGVALARVVGTGTATLTLADVEQADCLFIMGANPASNHPRLLHSVLHIKRRGGKIIVINPLRELGLVNFRVPSDWRSLLFGTEVADLYLQPHIGGDIALCYGIAKALYARGAVDAAFLAAHCAGAADYAARVAALDWDTIEARAGVARAAIEQTAALYAQSERAVFCWAMGITHHTHGTDNVLAIANLALLRGMVGKPGAGLMPLRGHSNIQGMGSVGTVPRLKGEMLARMEQVLGLALPRGEGLDTLGCIERAQAGALRYAWCLGGNLLGSNPERDYAARALGRLEGIVYLNTTLNSGHAWGRARETLILPVRARDEEAQATTQESMFNRVRLSQGGPARLPGPRSEVEIIAAIARRVLGPGGPVDWEALREHARIRALIAQVVPGYEEMAAMDSGGREFTVAGRVYHAPRFNTPDGRAHLHAMSLPEPIATGAGELRLMTIRSEGQFNTVVYEEEDLYRGQERRDVVLLNPSDRVRLGLDVDQHVRVRSAVGRLENLRVREIDIRPGNCALYYPEANVLIPRAADPHARTPAFKQVAVRIEPYGALTLSSVAGEGTTSFSRREKAARHAG